MSASMLGLLVIAITAQAGPLPEKDEDGRAYFERLYLNRAAITSGYLEYTVTTEVESREKSLEGSIRTYRLWFDKDRQRIDLKEVRPNDPANALNTRYASANGIHRIIDADRSDFCVREYTKDYLKGKEPPGVPVLTGHVVDPRLIGLVGMEYGLLQHHRLEEFKIPDPKAAIRVSRGEYAGKVVSRVSQHYPNESVKTYVVSGTSLLPLKMTLKFAKNFPDGRPAPDTRVEIESEVASWPNPRGERFDFPRILRLRRITDGGVTSAETVSIHNATFNVPVDPADLTWKALRPARGAGLIYNDDYKWDPASSTRVAWTGTAFEVQRDEAIRLDGRLGSASGSGRGLPLRLASYGTLGLGCLFAVVLAFLKISNRGRAAV